MDLRWLGALRASSAWRQGMEALQASPAWRWWHGKPAKEKLVYSLLAGAATLALLWLGLWRPLADWQAEQELRLRQAEQLAAWMAANEANARAAAAAGQGGPDAGGALLPLVTQAADGAGVRLSRLQPEDNGAVSVILEQQPFDAVVALLAELEQRPGIAVQRASIDAYRTAGLVNAQLRINRSNASGGA